MAEFRLRLPESWDFQKRHASTVHVVGLDGIPWPCRVSREDQILTIARNRDESGKIFVSVPFDRYGELTVSTGTLPERAEPYDFLTELARGTLNRLRNQTSIWEEGGLQIEAKVTELTEQAIAKLSESIVSPSSTSATTKDALAREALDLAMEAVFELSQNFGNVISKFRVSKSEFASFWFAGSGLKHTHCPPQERAAFDLWEVIADSESNIGPIEQRLILGPFVDASAGAIPISYDLAESEFEPRRRMLRQYCQQTLESLPQGVALIHAISGLNGTGHRNMGFSQQLQLAADVLGEIDRSKSQAPVLVSFDFPWAERLASSVGGTHPLQIADSLLRQGLPFSFIGLEINLDYWPAGSVSRDPLQWIDLIDIWSQLGLPLVLLLRVPQIDASPADESPTIDSNGDQPKNRLVNEVRENLNDEQRRRLIETVLPMIIARPSVHGVIWRQWRDGDDERFPGGGIYDQGGNKKKILELVNETRAKL